MTPLQWKSLQFGKLSFSKISKNVHLIELILCLEYIDTLGYYKIKQQLDNECDTIAMKVPCFAVYLLHQIGQSNLSLSFQLGTKYLKELSNNPFVDRNTENFYSNWIVPDIQQNIRALNINCSNCFLTELFWKSFVEKFSEMELCQSPLTRSCNESLTNAFILKAKIQAMFSFSLSYLGTAMAGKKKIRLG